MDLARHEAASLASLGIWFEIILMQLLVRHIYDKSVTSKHVRYALTEIADECRHSMMFARMIDWGGGPAYPVPRRYHNLARVLKTISTTPGSFAATLLGEEILDWMQRLTFPDERVQSLVRGVTRIHVVEEARHVRYAREELRRQMVTAPPWEQPADPAQLRGGGPRLLRLLRQPSGVRERRPGPPRGRRAGEGERPPGGGHADGSEAAHGLLRRHRCAQRGGTQAVEELGAAGLRPPLLLEGALRLRGMTSAPAVPCGPRVPTARCRGTPRPAAGRRAHTLRPPGAGRRVDRRGGGRGRCLPAARLPLLPRRQAAVVRGRPRVGRRAADALLRGTRRRPAHRAGQPRPGPLPRLRRPARQPASAPCCAVEVWPRPRVRPPSWTACAGRQPSRSCSTWAEPAAPGRNPPGHG